METTRQKKFARTIQKELGSLLQFEIAELQGLIVTVRQVRSTPDLQIARVYVSAYPDSAIGQVLEVLEREHSRIRYLLGSRLRSVLRVVPELEFFEDETDRVVSRIDELLEQIHVPVTEEDAAQPE